VVDRDAEWKRELLTRLEAVVEGRYRESASPGRLFRIVLTMTFEMPDGRDLVVKHFDVSEPEPREEDPPPEGRFAPYA
jgi:hypothetical protein